MMMTQIRLRDVVITSQQQGNKTGTYVDVDTSWKRDLAINGGDKELAWIASMGGEQWDDPDSRTPYVSVPMHAYLGPTRHLAFIYTYELVM